MIVLIAKRSVVSAANYAERSSFAKDQIFVDFRQRRESLNYTPICLRPSPGMINKYTVPTESYQTKMEFSKPVGSRSICQLRKYNERERPMYTIMEANVLKLVGTLRR